MGKTADRLHKEELKRRQLAADLRAKRNKPLTKEDIAQPVAKRKPTGNGGDRPAD